METKGGVDARVSFRQGIPTRGQRCIPLVHLLFILFSVYFLFSIYCATFLWISLNSIWQKDAKEDVESMGFLRWQESL